MASCQRWYQAVSRLHLYILAVCLIAVGLFVTTFQAPEPEDWFVALTLTALAIAAKHLRITLYERASISLLSVVLISAAILLGPTMAIALAVIASLCHWPWKSTPIRYIFDAGMNGTVAALVALLVPYLLRPDSPTLLLLPAGVVLGVITYVTNAAIVAVTMALSERTSLVEIWQERLAWLAPHYIIFGLLAVGMAEAGLYLGPVGLLIFAMPAFAMRIVTQQYVKHTQEHILELREANDKLGVQNAALERAHDATCTAFSGMLRARDDETEGHSERVVVYALALGQALNLTPDQLTALETGALLHDIGKVGVPDAILRKPGPLTDEEWAVMRQHPAIGHELTEQISFLRMASPVVRHHHERWDGAGYPDRLAGTEIPLAARIFTVADSLDAMLSDRPYRAGISLAQAAAEVERSMGTQFDPEVVKAFLDLVGSGAWPNMSRRDLEELVGEGATKRVVPRRRASDWQHEPAAPVLPGVSS